MRPRRMAFWTRLARIYLSGGGPLPPEVAIDPSEEISINAAIVLRGQFAQDSRTVASFLNSRNRGILALRSCWTTTGPWPSP